jgi:hypothetical protein
MHVDRMTAAEYSEWLEAGWRRFGHVLFRPACPLCRKCQSLRVPVDAFSAGRTQRRVWRANASGAVRIAIGAPSPTPAKRRLYERFHRYQQAAKGWPAPDADGLDAFAGNPFPTEEWCYFVDERLVAVGYVDALPDGLSAIYFFYDPLSATDRSGRSTCSRSSMRRVSAACAGCISVTTWKGAARWNTRHASGPTGPAAGRHVASVLACSAHAWSLCLSSLKQYRPADPPRGVPSHYAQ